MAGSQQGLSLQQMQMQQQMMANPALQAQLAQQVRELFEILCRLHKAAASPRPSKDVT